MKKSTYENFSKKELILRDHLAIDRTILANERTILAYVRTSLAIAAAGATLIYFSGHIIVELLGGVLIFFALGVLVVGLLRYKKMQKSINKIRRI